MTPEEIQTLKEVIRIELAASVLELRRDIAASADGLRTELRADIAASAGRLRTELQADIAASAGRLRTELRADIAASADGLRTELRADIAASADGLRTELRADVAASAGHLRTELHVLGDELRGGLTLVAEGHGALLDSMRALDRTVARIGERVEGIDLNVVWLRRRVAILAAAGTHPNRGRSG
jgi:hypothetical protein